MGVLWGGRTNKNSKKKDGEETNDYNVESIFYVQLFKTFSTLQWHTSSEFMGICGVLKCENECSTLNGWHFIAMFLLLILISWELAHTSINNWCMHFLFKWDPTWWAWAQTEAHALAQVFELEPWEV